MCVKLLPAFLVRITKYKFKKKKSKPANTLVGKGFRAFPPELRDEIFYYALVDQWNVEKMGKNKTPALLIALRRDRWLYAEAAKIFYRTNTFVLSLGTLDGFIGMNRMALSTIKNLVVDIHYKDEHRDDRAEAYAHLSSIRIFLAKDCCSLRTLKFHIRCHVDFKDRISTRFTDNRDLMFLMSIIKMPFAVLLSTRPYGSSIHPPSPPNLAAQELDLMNRVDDITFWMVHFVRLISGTPVWIKPRLNQVSTTEDLTWRWERWAARGSYFNLVEKRWDNRVLASRPNSEDRSLEALFWAARGLR